MNKKSKTFLADMINAISPSGYEHCAAAIWKDYANAFADTVETDVHGNSHAVINKGGKVKVMLAGHYDEIGFLISNIDDKGFLWIAPIGGWDPQIAQGQRVDIIGNGGKVVRGVIGKIAIHLQEPEQRKKVSEIKDLWVDIGAKTKKEAEKMVSIGDPLVIQYGFDELINNRVVGRAFDDRAGAFAILEAGRLLAKKKTQCEVHVVATVQEEIGLRGARTAAFGIEPDVGIAVDVTFATDHPNIGTVPQQEGNVALDGGPVITRGPNINPKLFDLIVKAAKEAKIPIQIVAEARGTGTDANAIQLNRAGVATALISIPLRHMHSPCELISLNDLDAVSNLLVAVIEKITPRTNFIPFLMNSPPTDSIRVFPDQWVDPTDFRTFFDHPEHPFEIDIGCGKGRFLLARSGKFPKTNFLGIDRMLNRIRKIDKKAQRLERENIRLLRVDGYYATTFLLPQESVDTYYVFFPDPWPKEKHHHNRLFNEPFMNAIARTLKTGGKIHAASDHLPYFDEIYALLKNDNRFVETETFVPAEDEVTDFELIFSHKTPGRASFIKRGSGIQDTGYEVQDKK